jgi:regulator of protease activity HflC (stomatin/prohibitin superfamily)
MEATMPLLDFLATHPLLVIIAAAVIVLLVKSVRVANQYERSVVFRLGNSTVPRGLVFISFGRLSSG